MGALELLWFALIILFIFVGVVRGYPKELGTTTGIMVALLILTEWGDRLMAGLDSVVSGIIGAPLLIGPQAEIIQSLFFLGLFGAMVFLSYHGETLAFRGDPPRGPLGVAMNALSGAANGYLIAGTLWYYLDRFNYPIRFLGLFSPPLTNLAQALLPFLPVPILQPYLLLFIAFLIFVRVLR